MVWRFAPYGLKVCPVWLEGLPKLNPTDLSNIIKASQTWACRPRRAFDAPELLPQALQALQMLRIGTNASQTEDSTVESSNEGL